MNTLRNSIKRSVIVYFLLSMLIACGGGGSDAPRVEEEFPRRVAFVTDTPKSSSELTLSVINDLLQVALLAQNIYLYHIDNSAYEDAVCRNSDGSVIRQLEDNDSNLSLSTGDVITITYQDCFVDEFEDLATGQIRYEILQLSSTETFRFLVDTNKLNINAGNNPRGMFQIDYITDGLNSHLEIFSSETLEVRTNERLVLLIDNITVTKAIDFPSAKYTVSANGDINEVNLNLNYNFQQVTPFSGFFHEYPNEGEMLLSTSTFDQVTITANNTVETRSYTLNGSTSTDSGFVPWNGSVDGAFSAFDERIPGIVLGFRPDNLLYLGFIGRPDLDNVGLTNSLSLVFSRPIVDVESEFGDLEFRIDNSPLLSIPANIDIEGPMITLTPQTTFEPGRRYDIPRLIVRSLDGQIVLSNLGSFQTNSDIVPSIRVQSLLYRPNDTPWLDASTTTSDISGELTYSWSEVSNTGLTFSEPTAARTEFTVPDSTTEDLEVLLTVTNSVGYTVTESIIIRYLPMETSYLTFDSPEGDFIGKGQQFAITSQYGEFSVQTPEDQPNYFGLTVVANNTDVIERYRLDLAAPTDQTLAVGVYEGAVRYPFQPPSMPGLSFGALGRGCGEVSGSFEILELEREGFGAVSRLSANFEQRCQESLPALIGQLRINSLLPINP